MCVADAAEATLPARCERAARRFFGGVAGRFAFLHVLPLFFWPVSAHVARVCALAGDSLLACAERVPARYRSRVTSYDELCCPCVARIVIVSVRVGEVCP